MRIKINVFSKIDSDFDNLSFYWQKRRTTHKNKTRKIVARNERVENYQNEKEEKDLENILDDNHLANRRNNINEEWRQKHAKVLNEKKEIKSFINFWVMMNCNTS